MPAQPTVEPTVEPVAEEPPAEQEVVQLALDETATEPTASIEDDAGDDGELLLDSGNMLSDEDSTSGDPDDATGHSEGTRPWINGEANGHAAPRREGTLFERMSSIARGAAKAQVDEDAARPVARDPLDIPRFLNRQNNQ